MSSLAGGDQGIPSVAVADAEVRSGGDHLAQDLGSAQRTSKQPGCVTVLGLHIDARTCREQSMRNLNPVLFDGHQQGCAALIILSIEGGLVTDELPDALRVACRSCSDQSCSCGIASLCRCIESGDGQASDPKKQWQGFHLTDPTWRVPHALSTQYETFRCSRSIHRSGWVCPSCVVIGPLIWVSPAMRGVAACLISWLLASGAQAHHSDKLDWHFYGESGSKVAFYGVPESHNVALSIRCEKPGTFYLNIAFAHAEIGRRRQAEAVKVPLLIHLPDGERQAIMVTGKVEKDDEAGDIVFATVSPRHPLIVALKEGKASSLGTRAAWIPLKGAVEVVRTLLERCH